MSIKVGPDVKEPTHDISLSDGRWKYGLTFAERNYQRDLQDLSYTPSTLRFSQGGGKFGDWEPGVSHIQQRDWTGGRGQEDMKDDTKFFDSKEMWTLTEDRMCPSIQWKFANGLRNVDEHLPGDVSWRALLGSALYISSKFTAGTSHNAEQIYLWVRRKGSPGTLTAALYSDSGGSPNVALQTATITTTNITDVISVFQLFDISTQAVTATTDYHIVVYGASADTAASHWEVGVDTSGTASKTSSDGSSWSSATYTMYYRLTAADEGRKIHLFMVDGQTYAVDEQDDGGAANLYMNGWRGKCTTGAATTLQDTNQSYTADRLIGATVKIIGGTGRGQVRTITDNDTDTITVAKWDETPSTDSEFIVYGTRYWQALSTTGLTKPVKSVAVADGSAFMAQGNGTNIRKMRFNAAASPPAHEYEDDGTNQADVLIVDDSGEDTFIIKATNSNATVSKGIVKAWGTAVSYSVDDTASGGGSNYLEDSGMTWTANEWVGATVTLDGGTGSGQKMQVTSNSPTMLIVNGTWATNPDSTSEYVLTHDKIIGSDEYDFTNLAVYRKPLAFKENGIWYDLFGSPEKLSLAIDALPGSSNGQAVAIQDTFLYFSFSHSVERMYSTDPSTDSTVDDIGPWRGSGLPDGRTGEVSAILPVLGWLFMGIDADDGTSCVMVYSGFGYHDIFRAWEANKRVRNVFWQPVQNGRPVLWINVGGELVYMEFPKDTLNPLKDTGINHQHESVIEYSSIDMDVARLPKFIKELTAISENLQTGIEVAFEYQVDEDIGTANWISAETFYSSPEDTLAIGEGNVKSIRPRLRLLTDTASTPPILKATVLEGFARTPEKRQYHFRFRVSDLAVDRLGAQEEPANDILDFLQKSARDANAVRMESNFSQMHDIDVIVEPPLPQRQSLDTITGNWSGLIMLTVREA